MRLEKSTSLRVRFFLFNTVLKPSSGPLVSKMGFFGALGLLGGVILLFEPLNVEIERASWQLGELVGSKVLTMLSSSLELVFPVLHFLDCLLQRGLLGHRRRTCGMRVHRRTLLLLLRGMSWGWFGRWFRRRELTLRRAEVETVMRTVAKRQSLGL
ncbi:hypothetical protein PC119_g28505, partial [Phytophthora cactorum]